MNKFLPVINKYRFLNAGTRVYSYREFSKELSKHVNVSHQTLYNWAARDSMPRVETMNALADVDGWVGDFARDMLAAMEAGDDVSTD